MSAARGDDPACLTKAAQGSLILVDPMRSWLKGGLDPTLKIPAIAWQCLANGQRLPALQYEDVRGLLTNWKHTDQDALMRKPAGDMKEHL